MQYHEYCLSSSCPSLLGAGGGTRLVSTSVDNKVVIIVILFHNFYDLTF